MNFGLSAARYQFVKPRHAVTLYIYMSGCCDRFEIFISECWFGAFRSTTWRMHENRAILNVLYRMFNYIDEATCLILWVQKLGWSFYIYSFVTTRVRPHYIQLDCFGELPAHCLHSCPRVHIIEESRNYQSQCSVIG